MLKIWSIPRYQNGPDLIIYISFNLTTSLSSLVSHLSSLISHLSSLILDTQQRKARIHHTSQLLLKLLISNKPSLYLHTLQNPPLDILTLNIHPHEPSMRSPKLIPLQNPPHPRHLPDAQRNEVGNAPQERERVQPSRSGPRGTRGVYTPVPDA